MKPIFLETTSLLKKKKTLVCYYEFSSDFSVVSEQIALESMTEWQDVEPNKFFDSILEHEPSKQG